MSRNTPTSLAFGISAYKRPDLLSVLVSALADRPVAVHIDKKVSSEPIMSAVTREVVWLPRHVCHWGMFGHVEASLEALRWFTRETNASHLVLLTGQCFPLMSVPAMEAALGGLGDKSIMEIEAFPRSTWAEWEKGGYTRTQRTHFHVLNRLYFLETKRSLPNALHPFGGSGYWCMSRKHAEYVLAYLASHPAVCKRFRSVFVPDEIFFQTILGNSAHADEVLNQNTHYFVFRHGSPHPNVITADQLDIAKESGCFFARKFESVELEREIMLSWREDEVAHELTSPAQ